jgi:hypothetical protein
MASGLGISVVVVLSTLLFKVRATVSESSTPNAISILAYSA